MRKILSLFILLFTFLACSKDEINTEAPQEEAKTYIVSFKMGGEITSISDSPLRAATSDLYGIQVYSKAPNESEKPYAYGLFDDPATISVKLMSGYTYRFICTMVKDGKNKITNHGSGYFMPFYISGPGAVQVNQQFIFSSTLNFQSIIYGNSTLNIDNKNYSRPNIDRYYGVTSNFSPSENGVVNINMKRTVFGVKVTTQDFSEGQLAIQLAEAPLATLTHPNTEIQDIYTFHNVADAYFNGDYTESVNLQINWIKNDGVNIPIATQTVTFTRNKLTTINVKVGDVSVNNGIGINVDNTGMTDGETVNIDGSTSTDTPVNP